MPSENLNDSLFLSALVSGGIIGGTVALVDQNFERAKFAIPLGMGLGIFLDYNVKKMQNHETSLKMGQNLGTFGAQILAHF